MLFGSRRAAVAANALLFYTLTILAFETCPSLAFAPAVRCGGDAILLARAAPGCGVAGLHMGFRDSGGPAAAPGSQPRLTSKNEGRAPLMDFLRAPKGTYRYVRPSAKELAGGAAGGVPVPAGASGAVGQVDLLRPPQHRPSRLASFLNLPSGTYRHTPVKRDSEAPLEVLDEDMFQGQDLSTMSADDIASSLMGEIEPEAEAPPDGRATQGRRRDALFNVIKGVNPFRAFKRDAQVEVAVVKHEEVLEEEEQEDPLDDFVGADALAAFEECDGEVAHEKYAFADEETALSTGTQQFDRAPLRRKRGLLMALKMAEMVLAVGVRDLGVAVGSALGIKVFEVAALGQNFWEAEVSALTVALCVVAFRGVADGVALPSFTLEHLEPQVRQMLGKPARVWEYARLQSIRSKTRDGESRSRRRPQQYSYYEKVAATLVLLLTSAQASAEQVSDIFRR